MYYLLCNHTCIHILVSTSTYVLDLLHSSSNEISMHMCTGTCCVIACIILGNTCTLQLSTLARVETRATLVVHRFPRAIARANGADGTVFGRNPGYSKNQPKSTFYISPPTHLVRDTFSRFFVLSKGHVWLRRSLCYAPAAGAGQESKAGMNHHHINRMMKRIIIDRMGGSWSAALESTSRVVRGSAGTRRQRRDQQSSLSDDDV